jgi:hypothetical protein
MRLDGPRAVLRLCLSSIQRQDSPDKPLAVADRRCVSMRYLCCNSRLWRLNMAAGIARVANGDFRHVNTEYFVNGLCSGWRDLILARPIRRWCAIRAVTSSPAEL